MGLAQEEIKPSDMIDSTDCLSFPTVSSLHVNEKPFLNNLLIVPTITFLKQYKILNNSK
jgi:hypothetical protein